MADLLRWLAVRTDLKDMLLSQVVKEFACIYGHACDWLTMSACRGLGLLKEGKTDPGFKKRSSHLVVNNAIKPKTKENIDWLWDIRCHEHPDKSDELETIRYTRQDANRARNAFERLVSELQVHDNKT